MSGDLLSAFTESSGPAAHASESRNTVRAHVAVLQLFAARLRVCVCVCVCVRLDVSLGDWRDSTRALSLQPPPPKSCANNVLSAAELNLLLRPLDLLAAESMFYSFSLYYFFNILSRSHLSASFNGSCARREHQRQFAFSCE